MTSDYNSWNSWKSKTNDIDENLDNSEKIYQKYNDEYKQLISNFSSEYLELCEWYVGPELPRNEKQTFLNSKDDINLLYFMFLWIFGPN